MTPFGPGIAPLAKLLADTIDRDERSSDRARVRVTCEKNCCSSLGRCFIACLALILNVN